MIFFVSREAGDANRGKCGISVREVPGVAASLREMPHLSKEMRLLRVSQTRFLVIFFPSREAGDANPRRCGISVREVPGDAASLSEMPHLSKETHLPRVP